MIIDIHTHCFPDLLAQRAVSTLKSKSDTLHPYTDGTFSDLKRSMKKSGVDISCIQNIATNPRQTRSVNEFAINSQEDGCLIPFGSIHPLYEDYKAEIKYLCENNIKGIKLHPDYQNFFVDNEAVFPLYEAIFDAELVLLFHAGVDIGLPKPVHCTPKHLSNMAKHFSGAKIIAAHLGGYELWEDSMEYLCGSDIYIDTSCAFDKLGSQRMSDFIKSYGASKVLFGTDSPWSDQQTEINNIKSLNLSKEDISAILGYNAVKLLNINY